MRDFTLADKVFSCRNRCVSSDTAYIFGDYGLYDLRENGYYEDIHLIPSSSLFKKENKSLYFWIHDMKLYFSDKVSIAAPNSAFAYSDEELFLFRFSKDAFPEHLTKREIVSRGGARYHFEKERYRIYPGRDMYEQLLLFPFRKLGPSPLMFKGMTIDK